MSNNLNLDFFNQTALKIFKDFLIDLKQSKNIETCVSLIEDNWFVFVSEHDFHLHFDALKETIDKISSSLNIDVRWKFDSSEFIKTGYENQFKFVVSEEGNDIRNSSVESTALTTLKTLIEKAYQIKASDLHITLTDKMNCHYRVDKSMQYKLADHLPRELGLRVFNATMNTTTNGDIDHDNTQSKNIVIKIKDPNTNSDVKLILRIEKSPIDSDYDQSQAMFIRITKSISPPTLDVLNIDSFIKKMLTKHIKSPQGLILVTGPTGSGKTNLLGGALWEYPNNKSLRTIEDPVEFKLDMISPFITQRSVDKSKWDSCLASILRQDPDGILLGEIRTLDQAQICIEAVNTGHLVMSTLHTKSSIGTIDRLLDLGVPLADLIAEGTLSLIIATRLAPKTCQACALRFDELPLMLQSKLSHLNLSPDELKNLRFVNNINSDGHRISGIWNQHSKNVDCECNGGVLGLESVAEFLEFTDSIRHYLLEHKSTNGLKDTLKSLGWKSIEDIAFSKIKSGLLDPFVIKDHVYDFTSPVKLQESDFNHYFMEE